MCTHTVQGHGRHSQDTIPRKPHPEKLLSRAVLDGLKPFAHLAQHLQSSHSLCTGFAQPVRRVGVACMAFAHAALCSHLAHITPQQLVTPQLEQEAEEGLAEQGFIGCYSSVSPLFNPA